MAVVEPVTKLDSRYSSEGAAMTPWFDARDSLDEARIFWLATVRPDGRPHVTPLFSVWVENTLYFSTGEGERKAKNLAGNTHCVILTGRNTIDGLNVIVEGEAVQITDEAKLRQVAKKYASKYNWHYTVRDEALFGVGGKSLVFEVQQSTAFGFGTGDVFSQTR